MKKRNKFIWKGGEIIKITELLSECKLDNSDMEEFKSIHPKQLIGDYVPIPVWRIHYSYVTARGNPKEADKYIIRDSTAWDYVEDEFKRYIEEQNRKHHERKLSNVKILDCTFMGTAILELE